MKIINTLIYFAAVGIMNTLGETKSKDDTLNGLETKTVSEKKSLPKKDPSPKEDPSPREAFKEAHKEEIQHLIDIFGISEDPLAERDRKRKEMFENYGIDYDDYYNNYDEFYGYGYETDKTIDNGNKDLIIENENGSSSGPHNETGDADESNRSCPVCNVREEAKANRIAHIKNTILHKIGFSSNNLPNVTGVKIPDLPAIQVLMNQHQMQADESYSTEDDFLPEDEIYGQVKRAYTIGQSGI